MRFSPVLLAVLTASATVTLTARPIAARTLSTHAADPQDEVKQLAEAGMTEPASTPSSPPQSTFAHPDAALSATAPIAPPQAIASVSTFDRASDRASLRSPENAIAQAPVIPESNPDSSREERVEATAPAPAPQMTEADWNSLSWDGSQSTTPTPTLVPLATSAAPASSLPTGPAPAIAQLELPAPAGVTPTSPPQTPPEPEVRVAEVAVSGATTPELETIVYDAIRTRAGQLATRSQIQADINAITATGYFSSVRAQPEDTPLGVRVTFVVQPNPVLRAVRVQDTQVLPQSVVDQAFASQVGQTLNFRRFQEGVTTINTWYRENGYILAQIADVQQVRPQVSPDGVAVLTVAEGVIESINVRFVTEDGDTVDDEGNPLEGKTRPYIILREFQSQPGDVFNARRIQADIERVYGLQIFQDLRIRPAPGQDPRKVAVTVDVVERNTGSLALGGGISSASGLFGTVSYQEQNLGGNNQRLATEIQLGERELQFDVSFTDPWIGGDPFRTSYTVNAFTRRSVPLVFQGGEEYVVDAEDGELREVRLPNGDRPRTFRLGGGVTFGRPDDPFDPTWRYSLGLQYQSIRIQDADGTLSPVDEFGNDLSFSGTGLDDLLLVSFAASVDRRNNFATPTSGSLLRLSTEQSIPVGRGSILLNRLRGSYSYFIPVDFTNFNEGPETLAFNVQGGVVLGDLPPYEAFSLGGDGSVRGYGAGDVGTGRAFLQGTVEYRFPIFSVIGGALFVDVASDLGTADNVPGNPAGVRRKPGFGIGFGFGVRIQSPLGPIRVDFGINDDGGSQIHFGLRERF